MAQTLRLQTKEGLNYTLEISSIEDISHRVTLSNFDESDRVNYWSSFFEELGVELLNFFLEDSVIIKLQVSSQGDYAQNGNIDGDHIAYDIIINSKYPATIYRHSEDLEKKLSNLMLGVLNPANYMNLIKQNEFGSKIGNIVRFDNFTFNFHFPFTFNAKSLSTNQRLHNCQLTSFLKFLPRNKDNYCVMHSLYKEINNIELDQTKSLNNNEEYMEGFNEFFEENNLQDFYIDNVFSVDKIELLEERLKVSINLYTFQDEVEIFYRSNYIYQDKIINLVVIPMCMFYNNKKPEKKPKKVDVDFPISCKSKNKSEFLGHISIKNSILDAHCAVLNTNIFLNQSSYKLCKYCNANIKPYILAEHEVNCLSYLKNESEKNRIKKYSEIHPNKIEKVFNRFVSLYEIPYATFDYETRTDDETKQHIPFSYSIFYNYIFNPEKSKQYMFSSFDEKEVLDRFLKDVEKIAKYHYSLQSVDFYDDEAKIAAGQPEKCVFCKVEIYNTTAEFNHSHFEFDTINKKLEGWACKKCNVSCAIKNKPLKFYGHNAAKYDNQLYTSALINSDKFQSFSFLAKSESRFSEICCSLVSNKNIRISFNDSQMLLTGSLSNLVNAWVSSEDDEILKKMLKIHYNQQSDEELDRLVKISKKKAIFPYSALNEKKFLKFKNPLKVHRFYDNLNGEDISKEDYDTYLNANKELQEIIGKENYTFQNYHDFYLCLDVVLLSLVLINFSKTCIELNTINPIWYISVSGYSFNSLLYSNRFSESIIPKIELPKVEIQQFIKRSIRGGFTRIFNKKILKKCKYTGNFYLDVNSLYPSVFATMKMPYKFSHWVEIPESVAETILFLKNTKKDFYYFCEVDIEPLAEEHQQLVSHFPLFPENIEIKKEYLSEDQLYRFKENNKHKSEYKNEVANTVTFFEKKNYVCSFSYLQNALRLGYKISKFHKITAFHQDFIMSEYTKKIYEVKKSESIKKNILTKQYKETKDPELLKEIKKCEARIASAKIMANGLYGSTLVNVDNHGETNVFDEDQTILLKKQISSLRFKSLLKADKKVLINRMKTTYQYNYPLCIGSAILWESKNLMSYFVYNLIEYLKENDLNQIDMLMTDTDSIVFSVPDFYRKWESYDEFAYKFNTEKQKCLDTSFSEEKYQMPETHEAFCCLKNEFKNAKLIEFYGLCSKVYSALTDDDVEHIKAKGISKNLQRKFLTHELYKNIVEGIDIEDDYDVTYNQFKNTKLGIKTCSINKNYISKVDTKSYYGTNDYKPYVFGSKEWREKTGL